MKKNSFPILIFVIIISLFSCLSDDSKIYLKTLNFDEQSRTLGVNYISEPDTAMHQVILKSQVRKSGYGVIVNVDHALTDTDVSKLIQDFRLQDINAVHHFPILSGMKPGEEILTAIESAKFTWIFSNNIYNLSGSDCCPLIDAFHQCTANGGILVINAANKQKFIECLQLY